MELNREQIIKALEWVDSLVEDSNDNDIALFTLGILYDKCQELTEENERLRGCVMSEEQVRNIANETIQQGIFIIKADTVRKMQTEIEKRCIKGGIYPAFVKSTIAKIAEEMLGGNNTNKED